MMPELIQRIMIRQQNGVHDMIIAKQASSSLIQLTNMQLCLENHLTTTAAMKLCL
jgi:hypothetical protein